VPNMMWGWGKMDAAAAAALLALDVAPPSTTPRGFALLGAQPNPFNPTTTLVLEVHQPGILDVRLMDLVGRSVWSHQEHVASGQHRIQVDGSGFASGLYFVHARMGHEVAAGKVLLIK